jgi:hypothetical protein
LRDQRHATIREAGAGLGCQMSIHACGHTTRGGGSMICPTHSVAIAS